MPRNACAAVCRLTPTPPHLTDTPLQRMSAKTLYCPNQGVSHSQLRLKEVKLYSWKSGYNWRSAGEHFRRKGKRPDASEIIRRGQLPPPRSEPGRQPLALAPMALHTGSVSRPPNKPDPSSMFHVFLLRSEALFPLADQLAENRPRDRAPKRKRSSLAVVPPDARISSQSSSAGSCRSRACIRAQHPCRERSPQEGPQMEPPGPGDTAPACPPRSDPVAKRSLIPDPGLHPGSVPTSVGVPGS